MVHYIVSQPMNVIYKFQSLYFNTDQKNHDLKSLGTSGWHMNIYSTEKPLSYWKTSLSRHFFGNTFGMFLLCKGDDTKNKLIKIEIKKDKLNKENKASFF